MFISFSGLITFSGVSKGRSRGHQVRRQPCKLGNFATFWYKKIPKIYFSIVFTNEKRVDRNKRVKNSPSKVRLIDLITK